MTEEKIVINLSPKDMKRLGMMKKELEDDGVFKVFSYLLKESKKEGVNFWSFLGEFIFYYPRMKRNYIRLKRADESIKSLWR